MFIFKKMIAPFLLPPGIFILILLTGSVWLFREKNRKGGYFAGMVAILLWLAALGPLSSRLVAGYEGGLAVPRHLSGDAIILLGGGIYEDVSDLTGRGVPADEMMARIVMAVRAERLLRVPIIVSGGAVFPGRSGEAHVVRRILMDLGVAKERIVLEEKSRDTAENARYASAICSERGFRRPLLVTTALHMPRAVEAFRRHRIEVTPLPVNLKPPRKRGYVWVDYLPDAASLSQNAYLIHEYLGLLYYRITR